MAIEAYIRISSNELIGYGTGPVIFENEWDDRQFRYISKGKVVVVGSNTFRECVDYSWGDLIRPMINGADAGYNKHCTVVQLTRQDRRTGIVPLYGSLDEIIKAYPGRDILLAGGSDLFHTHMDRIDHLYLVQPDIDIPGELPFIGLRQLVGHNWYPYYQRRKDNTQIKYLSRDKEGQLRSQTVNGMITLTEHRLHSDEAMNFFKFHQATLQSLGPIFTYLDSLNKRLEIINSSIKYEQEQFQEGTLLLSGDGLSKAPNAGPLKRLFYKLKHKRDYPDDASSSRWTPAVINEERQFTLFTPALAKWKPNRWPKYQISLPTRLQEPLDRWIHKLDFKLLKQAEEYLCDGQDGPMVIEALYDSAKRVFHDPEFVFTLTPIQYNEKETPRSGEPTYWLNIYRNNGKTKIRITL